MYLLLLSIHGLIRGRHLELGRDPDSGGQTQYVIELVRALAAHQGVEQIDLVTRRIVDPSVDAGYAERIEPLAPNARIVRIDAGPEQYLPKEQLWDHLDSFTDNLMAWLTTESRAPTIVHSHYADAGYIGVRIANRLEIPLVHTGHSLGRDKRSRLLATGLSRDSIEERFNMNRRIDAEEEVLANADLVIASTDHEIDQQYANYHYYQPERMTVIPPGTDLARFHPPEPGAGSEAPSTFEETLARFLRDPSLPMILALSRPDERKNIRSLVSAYGESKRLQELANLVIIAGTRDDIRELDRGPQEVLTELLLMLDLYDLYGRMALPKTHRADEVPEIYRCAARSRGVFVNPALTEPFGLTLLEAAATGLPLVATENGGPVDIIANCKNGVLVDPLDPSEIAGAILGILEDPNRYDEYARFGIEGVPRLYSWDAHADQYLERLRGLVAQRQSSGAPPMPRRSGPWRYRDRAVFTDIDQNLVSNPVGLTQLDEAMRAHRTRTVFGIATGRSLESALSVIRKHRIPMPDVLIAQLGTEIYYAPDFIEDEYWSHHVDFLWSPNVIKRVLREVDGLALQPRTNQGRFKISYYYDASLAPPIEAITALLRQNDLTVNVVHSFGQYLDILPSRASKGEAVRYFARCGGIALDHVLVAGGSGADLDMMRGNTLAVVVANRHHEELSGLDASDSIFFAKRSHALGILEAIDHYGFFEDLEEPAAT